MISSVLLFAMMAGANPQPMESTATGASPRIDLGTVTLEVPPSWQRRFRSGTYRFDSPKGDAYFVVDTGQVQTAGMEPSVCLGKITEALGNDGGEWHKLVLGGYPAAHRSGTDTAKSGGVTVRTHTFVGCNGTTTWSILFHVDDKAADAYAPQVVSVAKSLEFVRAPQSEPPKPKSDSGAGK